ncbi:MAG: hypothetical protein RNU03_01365 [Candidatus Sedimenticola sp. (ex Thyasira tokunagai)]
MEVSSHNQACRYLVKDFGTSKSPKSTRLRDSRYAPTVLRTSRFRIAHCSKAACALLHHDSRNDSTAFRMHSLYALHRSLPVAIPAIQPRLRLSGTNRLGFQPSMAISEGNFTRMAKSVVRSSLCFLPPVNCGVMRKERSGT